MRVIGLSLVVTGCTAPNPAFGEGTTGSSAASEASSESAPEPTRTTGETTRGDDTTTADATSTTGDDPSVVTSDDENSVSDSDPIYDLGDDDGSTTESGAGRVWLFSAPIDGGAFGDPARKDPSVAGNEQCADAYATFATDVCDTGPVALIRTGGDPFDNRKFADLLGAEVLSVDGYAIAETLKMFFDGEWLVQALYDAPGGGLEELDSVYLVTGGRTDGSSNCGGWLDPESFMTLGDPDGEEGWFEIDEVSCANQARILCICAGT